jgi:two-component sensor histidine kinase
VGKELDNAKAAERLGELLLRESDHRAKNTLTLAAALLSRQQRFVADPEVRAPLQAASQRLLVLAKVHAAPYAAPGALILVRPYLRDICEPFSNDRVSVSTAAPNLKWPVQIVSPLGLLATEAVMNALKHAFPHDRRGTVRVDLSMRGCGKARLVVEDDGVGLPEIHRANLGFELIQGLAGQLGGTPAYIGRGSRGGCLVSADIAVPHFRPCRCSPEAVKEDRQWV